MPQEELARWNFKHHCTCTKKTFFWKTSFRNSVWAHSWGVSLKQLFREPHGGEHRLTGGTVCICGTVTLTPHWIPPHVLCSQTPDGRNETVGSRNLQAFARGKQSLQLSNKLTVRNKLFNLTHLLLHSSYFNRDYHFTHRCPPKCDTVCPAFRWKELAARS